MDCDVASLKVWCVDPLVHSQIRKDAGYGFETCISSSESVIRTSHGLQMTSHEDFVETGFTPDPNKEGSPCTGSSSESASGGSSSASGSGSSSGSVTSTDSAGASGSTG